jgi:hypothetical protein
MIIKKIKKKKKQYLLVNLYIMIIYLDFLINWMNFRCCS